MSTKAGEKYVPLAEKMRPQTLDRFYGQEHLIGKGKILSQLIEADHLVSIIFWGPPGSGKTTLGYILAKHFNFPYVFFSAVLSGIKEVKQVMAKAESHKNYTDNPLSSLSMKYTDSIKPSRVLFCPMWRRGTSFYSVQQLKIHLSRSSPLFFRG